MHAPLVMILPIKFHVSIIDLVFILLKIGVIFNNCIVLFSMMMMLLVMLLGSLLFQIGDFWRLPQFNLSLQVLNYSSHFIWDLMMMLFFFDLKISIQNRYTSEE